MNTTIFIKELLSNYNVEDNSKPKKYKYMYNVLGDIIRIWNNINEIEQNELATEIAGNRYFDIFNEIIDCIYE